MDTPAPKPNLELIDPVWTIRGPDHDLFIQHDQEITDDFLSRQGDKKINAANSREGEFMEVADIPVAVVEKWKREGFDILSGGVTAEEIVRRLVREDLTAFLSTNKRV